MNSSTQNPSSCNEPSSAVVRDELFIPYIVCVILNIPTSAFAFFGNALILAALRKVSSLHAPSKALLSNLALTDLCVGLVVQPMFVSLLLFEIGAASVPVSRFAFYCLSYPPSVVSFSTMTVISTDRLLALYSWRTYHEVVNLQRVVIMLVFLWILGAVASVIATTASYLVYMILGSILIAFCITVCSLSFLLIFRKLRSVNAQVSTNQEPAMRRLAHARSPLQVARYRKLAYSLWHMCWVLWLSYIPFMLITILLGVVCREPWTKAAQEFTLTLILLSSSINPVLYCWRIRDVRRATVKLLRQIFCCAE